jgi:hypothetical protein
MTIPWKYDQINNGGAKLLKGEVAIIKAMFKKISILMG